MTLVDMEMAKAQAASVQATARQEDILLQQLLRALPRLTASPVMLVNMDKLARLSVSTVTLASIPLTLPVPPVETATLVDMELLEARLASAQATAGLAGILLRRLLQVLVAMIASSVALASMAQPLVVTPQPTASIATLVDMERVGARAPSAQAAARLAGFLQRRLLRALPRLTALLVRLVNTRSRRATHAATVCSEQVNQAFRLPASPTAQPPLTTPRAGVAPRAVMMSWYVRATPFSCRTPQAIFTTRPRRMPKLHAAYHRVLAFQQLTKTLGAPALAPRSAQKTPTRLIPSRVPHATCARMARATSHRPVSVLNAVDAFLGAS